MKKIRLVMKVIAMVLLGFTLFTSRLLPLNIMIAIGAIEVLLLILAWKRKVLQVFVVLLMLITSSGLMYVEFVAERIINYDPNQVNTISFFVVKDSRTTSIKTAIKNELEFAVSTLLDDKVVTFVEEKLAEKEYMEDLVSYEGIADGISGLLDGTFDVLVVDQGYLSTVLEYDPTFLDETKVIWSIEKTDEIINLTEASVTKEPFVVYIAGVDNRDEFQANRVDVNMLAVVDPIKHNITLVSVPRDAYVQLGCKTRTAMDKLTHAGVYGIDCSIKTMQNLLGVEITYYSTVYFDTVTKLVGALGTIDVYL
ncbi:MAG: LCP family protein, partial [Erysipelotrichaceae bacterium]|nr:LCP family protein [Erysipelotrichaceae bacterium]